MLDKQEMIDREMQRRITDAKGRISWLISLCQDRLKEAQDRLDCDYVPNTCGVLQSATYELDMAVAQLQTLKDTQRLYDQGR